MMTHNLIRWFGTHAYIHIYIYILYVCMYIYIYNSIVILYPYAHDGTFKRGTRTVCLRKPRPGTCSPPSGWHWSQRARHPPRWGGDYDVIFGYHVFFMRYKNVISIDIYVIFMWYVCHAYLIFVYICVIFMNYKNLHSLKCSAILG